MSKRLRKPVEVAFTNELNALLERYNVYMQAEELYDSCDLVINVWSAGPCTEPAFADEMFDFNVSDYLN